MTTRIPKKKVSGLTGAVIKFYSRRMLGEMPEGVEVYWHHRKVLKASMGIGSKVRKWDKADENLKSFAQMAVATQVGCSWCLDFGYFHAQNEGLDLAKASQVPRWRESDAFTALERDVMEYAEAMTETPPTVTDELSARLLDQLGPAAVIELNAVVAFANMTTRGNVAFGIESQGFSSACEVPLAEPAHGPLVARTGVPA